jgi:hypothetical protein
MMRGGPRINAGPDLSTLSVSVRRFTLARWRLSYPLVDIHLRDPPMPISMTELEQIYRRTYRRLVVGICVVYGAVLLLALLVLTGGAKVASPVTETAKAALVGETSLTAPQPIHRTRPSLPLRTVRAD